MVQTQGGGPAPAEFVTCDHTIENRIKEFKVDLHADRLSCEWHLANQFRLVLHVAAYHLYQQVQDGLQQVVPRTSEWAGAQVGTLREKLFKVAVRVRERCRTVRVSLPTSYPWQEVWHALLTVLQGAGPTVPQGAPPPA